jgi:hypothetical protein
VLVLADAGEEGSGQIKTVTRCAPLMAALWRLGGLAACVRPEPLMTLPRSVADVLADHAVFEVEYIDRMYLNVWVPARSKNFVHATLEQSRSFSNSLSHVMSAYVSSSGGSLP